MTGHFEELSKVAGLRAIGGSIHTTGVVRWAWLD